MNLNHISSLFLLGQIQPLLAPVLKNPEFQQHKQLLKIAQQYIHGECHFWSLALLRLQPELELYFIYDHKRLIHSFVVAPSNRMAWDANGILEKDKITLYWEEALGHKVRIKPGKKELLENLIKPDSNEMRQTEEHITEWLTWLYPVKAS